MYVVLIIIFIIYVIYNEFHKRIIKRLKKELVVPRDFYENLKEVIQYIDSTLETVKNKQETINKVYLKIQGLKKEIENLENQKKSKSKRGKKEKIVEKHEERLTILDVKNGDTYRENTNEDLWEELLKEMNNDKIDFSFHKEESKEESKQNIVHEKEGILTFLGRSFRKALGISPMPIVQNFDDTHLFDDNIKIEENKVNTKMMSLDEFENSILSDKNLNKIQPIEDIEIQNTQNRFLEKKKEFVEEDYNIQEDPRDIIIKESKKIFLELQTLDEKYRFVNKLLSLGFTKEEVQQITGFSTSEIILISNLKKEK